MQQPSSHIPVMLNEVVAALEPKDKGIYVDGTFGRGGYARALLTAAATQVFGIDRDPDAIAAGQAMVKEFAPRLTLIHGAFGDMERLLAGKNVATVDGIAFDLGVSSPQLDEPERGFSFMDDGPLDMRMDRQGPTAADIVNESGERELADIIFKFGEERFARRVAKRIVEAREKARLTRTLQLAEIIRKAVPRSNDGIDPATRTFQALRIVVNDEMGELRRGLCAAERLLKPQGRLAVVSFHSLEDRFVKDFLRRRSAEAPRASRHAPANDDHAKPSFIVLTRKPRTPADDETKANIRSRSARLRVGERTAHPAVKENAA
jgi:16S rRNA (cytosine1402-N4)-methyltransferase